VLLEVVDVERPQPVRELAVILVASSALLSPRLAAAQSGSQHDAAALAEADVQRDPTTRVGREASEQPTAGERARAAELTARASSAYRAQRYDAAAKLYERAFAIIPAVELQFNLGQCYRQLNEVPEARAAFARYLRARPRAPEREQIERWLADTGGSNVDPTPVSRAPEPHGAATAVPAVPVAAADRSQADQERDRALGAASVVRVARDTPRDDGSKSVYERWWFWTAIGVVAVGGATAAILIDRDHGDQPAAGTLGTVRWN
jgi:tetratricopeptide (TPR) repeat protein